MFFDLTKLSDCWLFSLLHFPSFRDLKALHPQVRICSQAATAQITITIFFIRRAFMFLFVFLSSTNRTHKPSVSRPQVFHFHVVRWARLGEKGLKPFYWSCALWVLKITALQPHEGQTINCKSLYCIAKSKKPFKPREIVQICYSDEIARRLRTPLFLQIQ